MVLVARKVDNAESEGPSIEGVPEATGAQTKVRDELEVEAGENPLALWMAAVEYETRIGGAGCLPSCHSPMQDEWGNKHSFGQAV